MYTVIVFVHLVIALGLIVLVLLQQGKGAAMGAAFGSGASSTVFGAQGSGSFIFKLTAAMGIAFFTTCLVLNYLASHAAKQSNQIIVPVKNQPAPAPQAPAKQLPVKE